MSLIVERLKSSEPVLSIEVFPPKTDAGIETLKKRMKVFQGFSPVFISVTYGAGGITRGNTVNLARWIQAELGVPSVAHLTCVGHTQAELKQIARDYQGAGIQNIMALRGDPPGGLGRFEPVQKGFQYASELIELLSSVHPFVIGCAGYPEGHIESESLQADIDALKRKIDCGAQFVVTQFFLENVYFYRYRDLLREQGIRVPILPGILPLSNYSQIMKFALLCGCTIPAKVIRGLHGRKDEDQERFGLDHAAEQIEDLIREGVDGIHLYALNKETAVERLAPLIRSSRRS